MDSFPWLRDLARVDALLRAGISERMVFRRLESETWQRVLPHVVCRTTGALTPDQRRHATLLYAGTGAILSHASAASVHGLLPEPHVVHVTVPHGRHRRDVGFARIHQSRRGAAALYVEDLPVTLPARSVVDTAVGLPTLVEVRAIVCTAVQRGRTTVGDLQQELVHAPRRGSSAVRQAVAEVAAGVRSAPEAEFLALMKTSGLPLPEMNAPVRTPSGVKLVDALWRELCAGVEIDGRAYHLDARQWAADLGRQNALLQVGIAIVRFPVRQLRTSPDQLLGELDRFLRSRAGQLGVPLLPGRRRGAAG